MKQDMQPDQENRKPESSILDQIVARTKSDSLKWAFNSFV